MGALKKRDLKQKVKEKIAADIIKRKGDVSKSDDRYAYESVEPEVKKVDEMFGGSSSGGRADRGDEVGRRERVKRAQEAKAKRAAVKDTPIDKYKPSPAMARYLAKTRKEDYSANPAQQAAIAIAKKERKQDLKVAQKKKMKEEVVTELNRFEKEKGMDTKTGKPVTKGGTAKNDRAFQSVMKKFGKQRMGANQPKKVRGAKNPNETSPTKQKMTRMKAAKASSRAFETRAKKAGYKTAQDYANVVARYGSEDNMKKGRGLGT